MSRQRFAPVDADSSRKLGHSFRILMYKCCKPAYLSMQRLTAITSGLVTYESSSVPFKSVSYLQSPFFKKWPTVDFLCTIFLLSCKSNQSKRSKRRCGKHEG